jgi:response regulator RpfG family c-di-GMP phosphodiesterase
MNERILFVDDDENILAGYKRNLRSKFNIITNPNALEALESIKTSEPFSVVVSDFKMPVMDGINFLSWVKAFSPDTVRIMLTGFADINNAIKSVNEGNVFRFLTKPINNEILITALKDGIEQYKLVTAEKVLLNKTLKGSIKILIDMLSAVNPTAFSHANELSKLARKIAERLKVENVWEVELTAMLSQIGCVTIPEELLDKKMSGKPLTEEENSIYISHPKTGSSFIKNIPRLEEVSDAIEIQMERFDELTEDNSRPDKGKSVLRSAQIIKISSDFDAFLKSGKQNSEALNLMVKETGKYNPEILAALEAEIAGVDKSFVIKNVMLEEIKEGMVLAQGIYDIKGVVLLRKGMEINEVMKIRLKNLSKIKKIVEPVKVIIPS